MAGVWLTAEQLHAALLFLAVATLQAIALLAFQLLRRQRQRARPPPRARGWAVVRNRMRQRPAAAPARWRRWLSLA